MSALPAGMALTWYKVASIADIYAANVPEIFKAATIENLKVEVFLSIADDFNGEERTALTVYYNGVYLPLGLNGYNPFYLKGYAVYSDEENIYLGIEN